MKQKLYITATLFTIFSVYAETNTPEIVVTNFIRDYYVWNKTIYELSEKSGTDLNYLDIGEKKYQELISKYCPPGYKSQPIAFGGEPFHHPEEEKIVDVENTGDSAIVYTEYKKKKYGADLTNNFEYHLKLQDGKLYLTSVLVVIDGKRYESL